MISSLHLNDSNVLKKLCIEAINTCDSLMLNYSDNKTTTLTSLLSNLTDIIYKESTNQTVISKSCWKILTTFQIIWKLIKIKILDKLRLYDKVISVNILEFLNIEEELTHYNKVDVFMLLYYIINCDIISIYPTLLKYGIEVDCC
jgi:hypothetical protein